MTCRQLQGTTNDLSWVIEHSYSPSTASPPTPVAITIRQRGMSGRDVRRICTESLRGALTASPAGETARLALGHREPDAKKPATAPESADNLGQRDHPSLPAVCEDTDNDESDTEEGAAEPSPTDNIEQWLCPVSALANGLTGFDRDFDPARTRQKNGRPKQLCEYPLEYAAWIKWFSDECRRRYAGVTKPTRRPPVKAAPKGATEPQNQLIRSDRKSSPDRSCAIGSPPSPDHSGKLYPPPRYFF